MRLSEKHDVIVKKLFEFKTKVKAIEKKADNPFFDSKYADLSDILDAVEPILQELGLFITQGTDIYFANDGKLHTIISTRITDSDTAQFAEGLFPVKNAKGDAQGEGAGNTYGRRFGLQTLLGLKTIDDDGNEASGKEPKKEPKQLANNGNKEEAQSPPSGARQGFRR